MPEVRRSTTNTLSLGEVAKRLSRQDAVEGIIIIGSAANDRLTPVSDYDLAVVLSEAPLPLHVGMTNIDGRFTDLIFFNGDHLAQVLDAAEPPADRDWAGVLVRYLADGNLVYDRDGRLNQAKAKAQQRDWLRPIEETDLFGPWTAVNYNLQ